MATTTNYGWTTPDDTALVKDGAAAIRSLGTAIDTSMNTALGTKKAGLVLLNTTSFSAVASASLPASTFTSTYENYRIIYNFTMSVSDALRFRVRAAGSDATGSIYSSAAYFTRTNNTSGMAGTSLGATSVLFEAYVANQKNNLIIDLMSPQLAEYTLGTFTSHLGVSTTDAKEINGGLMVANTTAYDSATLFPATGTITGKYSVYGYNF